METDRKVLYFTRYLPAYRIPVFNKLNKELNGRLVVCAGQTPTQSSVLLSDDLSGREFEQISLVSRFWKGDKIHFQNYHPAFEKYPTPAVILAEESPRSITLPFLLREAKKRDAGRALWGIFYSVHREYSGSHPLQYYRIQMADRVEACVCYTRGVRDSLLPFVDPAKLFVAQNTLDTDQLFPLYDAMKQEGQASIRKRLQIGVDEAVFVFSAILVKRKGTRELLDIFGRIQADRPATLLVMGSGPELEPMKSIVDEKQLKNVRFLGSVPLLKDSAPYFFAADMALIPGYVGLVANHALCLGVPLVTMEAPGKLPFHGPEIESIVDGYNGFISERNLDDLESKVRALLSERSVFSENAIKYAREHITLDQMVGGLTDAINHAWQNRASRS